MSPENPYFYQGEYASGLGSSHTFYRYIWPIALSIQGLTTTDKAEKKFLLDQLVACDGGTGVMHESFHVDDPTLYSREWFSWANMMFCELVLDYLDIANTLRKSLQTTSALSATSKLCFEQPAASFLVCSLIFIEYKELAFASLILGKNHKSYIQKR